MQGRLPASESYPECRARARKGVDLLVDGMQSHTVTALMGHGFFNFLLSKELKKRGWQLKQSGQGFWSLRILTQGED